jgi:hypothetical protein
VALAEEGVWAGAPLQGDCDLESGDRIRFFSLNCAPPLAASVH